MVYSREERRRYQAEYRRKRHEKAISDLGGRCRRCGSTSDLQINHKDPREKAFNLSGFWGTIADYEVELQKCEVLCGPCHVIVTREQWELGIITYGMHKNKNN